VLQYLHLGQVQDTLARESKLRRFCSQLLIFHLTYATGEELKQLVNLQQEIPELAIDILVEVQNLVKSEIEIDDPRGPLNGGSLLFSHAQRHRDYWVIV
jgi:hypothetical protein